MDVVQLSDQDDALSDVLQAIHLRGRDVCRTVATKPMLHREPGGARAIYIVDRGTLNITLPDREVVIRTGGLAMLPRGFEHGLRAASDTVWITGTFDVEARIADPVLQVLPSAIVIDAERTHPWLEISHGLIVSELLDPNPGSRVMISRLLDLLFIRSLRDWAAEEPNRAGGWLTATMDPHIARALTAVHRRPGHAVSVDELAQHAQLSRSAFAERFTRLMGESPGRYVSRRRLAHADELLTSSSAPLSRIAAEAGYESEAAFSRAFSRAFGESPSLRRRSRQPTTFSR
ncbi:MAG TPA: AraC family transcriptional regulator [Diaminobutyricibacter sp.]